MNFKIDHVFNKNGMWLQANILSQKIVQSIIFQMNYFQIDGGKPPVVKNAHTKHAKHAKLLCKALVPTQKIKPRVHNQQ